MSRFSFLFALAVFPVLATSACAADSEDVADGQQNQQVDPEPPKLRHPIVLVHGFAATSSTFNGFSDDVVNELKAQWGPNRVFEVTLPAFQPPPKRAKALKKEILKAFPKAEKVNIIAHSMGGLDARYLASPNTPEDPNAPEEDKLRWGSHIESITTISTPHRGSAIAPVMRRALEGEKASAFANAVLEGLGAVIKDKSKEADILATLDALSPDKAEQFNKDITHDPNVTYYSWAGVSDVSFADKNPLDIVRCKPVLDNHHHLFADGRGDDFVRDRLTPILIPIAAIVGGKTKETPDKREPNDGLVQVESAKYKNFMGCIPADHANEVGATNPQLSKTTYNARAFYRTLTADLAHRKH